MSTGFGISGSAPPSSAQSNRVRRTGLRPERRRAGCYARLDGTRFQVEQTLAQGPQAKKGRARETKACRRRPKARQQPTAERITQLRRCPLSGSTTEKVAVAFWRKRDKNCRGLSKGSTRSRDERAENRAGQE